MASTVYYGKSVTAADVQAKVVKLQLTQEELSRLQEELSQDGTVVEENLLFNSGDELVVHFAHANEVDYPSLVLSIGDSNEEISISTDNGKSIHSNSPTPAVAGCWDSGEVVTFVYTVSETLVGATASNEAYWVMDDGGIADRDTYGVTKLVGTEIDDTGKDDNSAITLGGVKYLLNNMQGNTLSYVPRVNSGVELGTLTLDGDWIDPQSVTLFAPEQITYSRQTPVSGGTTLSLVNTGDMYNWNQKTSNTGTVTSISAGPGLTTHIYNNGAITTSGTISLQTSGVTSGSYGPSANVFPAHGGTFTVPYFTVDAYGRVTSASTKTITLPTVSSVAVPYFKIVPIYTKNIYYNSAGSNKPTSINYNGAHGSDSAETYIKGSSGGGITIDQLIEVAVPSYSGYRFAGVVGYNVNEAGKKTDNTEWTHKIPGSMNVWCCAPNNSYTRVRLEMTNQATTANCVYLTIYLLYISNSFVS